jgi:hypothetical protein
LDHRRAHGDIVAYQQEVVVNPSFFYRLVGFRASQSDVTSMRDRETWARSIDRLLEVAENPPPVFSSVVIRPTMLAPCVGQLRAIAAVLRDPTQSVSPMAMHELRAFICDGSSSPLHGRDPEAAAAAARDVASLFRIELRSTGHDLLAA